VVHALKRWEAVGVERTCRSRTTSRPTAQPPRAPDAHLRTLELTATVDRLATVRDLDTEAWSLPGADILQLAFEVRREE
jgi:hypothetical protein